MTDHTIGIDISKSHLDVFHLEGQEAQRFENAPRGYRALQKWLAQLAVGPVRVAERARAPASRPARRWPSRRTGLREGWCEALLVSPIANATA